MQSAGGGEDRQPRLQAGRESAIRIRAGESHGRVGQLVPPVFIDGKFEFDPVAGEKAESQFKTADEIVAFYQKTVPDKLKQLRAMPGDKLAREVDFFGMMKMPAVSLLGLANNHSIHHRGQLAAYLRPMGSKVPAIYGGSADEPMQH